MSGPSVVAIGGGHGLAASLRAIRTYAGDICAVVSVADDGGSSGRLRDASPRPAVGDLRKCVIALAGDDSRLLRSMSHRFDTGDLAGHAFGNLLITAFSEVDGDLVAALDEVARLVGAVGRVLPATVEPVQLAGRTADGERVLGQVSVQSHGGVESVELLPVDPAAPDEALDAIEHADQLVLGPGSLFTSVLAATAVPEIGAAVAKHADRVVYVCNLHPELPETSEFGVADHVATLARHGIEPEVVLYDPATIGGAEGVRGARPAPLADARGLVHDAARLGAALSALV